MKAPSLRDIAREVGVSPMTVSRALTGNPYVDETLRAKIRSVAERIGYKQDPKLQRLMNYMRLKRNAQPSEVIALVWPDATSRCTENSDLYRFVQSARTKAEAMGFKLEEYYPRIAKQSHRNLSRQLYNRGISAVILSMVIERSRSHASLNWDHFSCISVGEGLWRPRLHRIQFHHYYGMMTTMQRLRHLGYERIGAILIDSIQKRMHHSFTASFLVHHPLPVNQASKLVMLEESGEKKIISWLEKEKPDVVICDHATPPSYFKKFRRRIPQDIGYVTLHRSLSYPETSGIDQREDLLGENAVELVTALYHRHERGIPDSSKIVLYEGNWVDGATTRNLHP